MCQEFYLFLTPQSTKWKTTNTKHNNWILKERRRNLHAEGQIETVHFKLFRLAFSCPNTT